MFIGIILFLNKHTTSQGDDISDKSRINILETQSTDLQERVARVEDLTMSIMKTNNNTVERIADLESSTGKK